MSETVGNRHRTSDIERKDDNPNQELETRGRSTSNAFAKEPSHSHPLPQATSYLALFPENNIRTGDQILTTYPGMDIPCIIPTISTNWSANDVGYGFSWNLSGAVSPVSQNIAFSTDNNNSLNSPGGFEWTYGLTPTLLGDNDNVTIGHCFDASDLSQGAQFDTHSDFQNDYRTLNPSGIVMMSQAFNQAALEPFTCASQMTSAQTSLFQALLSLGEPLINNNSPTSHSTFQPTSFTTGSQPQSKYLMENLDCRGPDENEDPERIQTIICGQMVLDRSVESNTLPFALHGYAVWVQRTMFDPSRAAPRTRDYVIRHFAESKQSRSRTILIANIFRSIATNPEFSLSYLPKLSALRRSIQGTLADAVRQINPSRDIQIRESIRALEQTLELFTAATKCEPLDICLRLMREAAPVFRNACPEPVDQLVHLPSVLIHPNANMRHYPVMDVYFSIITGLPTNLQYDTSLRSPVDASVLYIDNHLGLSWLYGQPDRITLILARMNSLYQNFGAGVDEMTIQEIEHDIRCFKAISGSSPDPSLLVARLVVQECWRQVAYIYLYMTLCDADALDARVKTAQQRLMRLIGDTKPSPVLDRHLAPCLGMAGVVTHRPNEREATLMRLRGLPECSRPDSCFSNCARILEELWVQTDRENRPAKWVDFRLSTLRVLGIQ